MARAEANGPEMVGGGHLVRQSGWSPSGPGGPTRPAVDSGPAIQIKIKKIKRRI
jgi:hypothetical protein